MTIGEIGKIATGVDCHCRGGHPPASQYRAAMRFWSCDGKNKAHGMSDIEESEPDWHLAARIGASERGSERVSIKNQEV